MKFALLLFWGLSFSTWAQIKYQTRVSKEIPGKTNEEIKEIVLFNGAMEAIKISAPELGYDFSVFTKKLDEKFKTYFESYKSYAYIQKFGKNYNETLTSHDREIFEVALNEKKDSLYRSFTKVSATIQSYTVKNGVVEIILEKGKVEAILRKIIKEEVKQYSRLWIVSEINLIGLAWENFELSSENSFKDPIDKSWIKWMAEHIPGNVEDVALCRGSCSDDFKSWEQKHQDEAAAEVGPDYLDGIWAKVTMTIRPGIESSVFNEKNFEWEGRIVFLDVNTKRLLASQELPLEKKTFRVQDQKKINSDLASLLYRTGVSGFTNLGGKLQNRVTLNRVSRLTIKGSRHLLDIQALISELKTRGSSLGLEAQLDFFKANEAEILCFYRGEEKSFTDLLSQLKELKLSQSYKVINEYNGIHHILKLVTE